MIHLVVFYISSQGYFTFLYRYAKHNREDGRKEQMNKHGLGLAPSPRRGEVSVTLLAHYRFLWANASVYSSEISHKATGNADLNSRVGPPGFCRSTGPSSHLSDFCWLVSSVPDSYLPDWPVLLTGPFWSLLLNAFFCLLLDLPSLVHPVSWEFSCAGTLSGFCAKTDKGILWLAPTHRETEATHSVMYDIKNQRNQTNTICR